MVHLNPVSNFVGCIRSIYVNSVNVLQRLRHQSAVSSSTTVGTISGSSYPSSDVDGLQVVYGDVGTALTLQCVRFGCHSLAMSAFRLTRPGAVIQLKHSDAVDNSVNFRLSFVTVKPDGVLMDTSADDSTRGVLQVSSFLFVYCHGIAMQF